MTLHVTWTSPVPPGPTRNLHSDREGLAGSTQLGAEQTHCPLPGVVPGVVPAREPGPPLSPHPHHHAPRPLPPRGGNPEGPCGTAEVSVSEREPLGRGGGGEQTETTATTRGQPGAGGRRWTHASHAWATGAATVQKGTDLETPSTRAHPGACMEADPWGESLRVQGSPNPHMGKPRHGQQAAKRRPRCKPGEGLDPGLAAPCDNFSALRSDLRATCPHPPDKRQ